MATRSGYVGDAWNLRTDVTALEVLREHVPDAIEGIWYTDGMSAWLMCRGNFMLFACCSSEWFWWVDDLTTSLHYHCINFTDGMYPTAEAAKNAVVGFYERELAAPVTDRPTAEV